jgi:Arc/MetJ-type ribon-helix-helix transcriptional regulator
MAKKNIKAALGASMKAEEKSFKSRFDQAEAIFGKEVSTTLRTPTPDKSSRVIRDSFTLPEDDYGLIAEIKKRCLNAGLVVNKSEAIRAGLNALNSMSDKELLSVIEGLTKIKPGRPSQTI